MDAFTSHGIGGKIKIKDYVNSHCTAGESFKLLSQTELGLNSGSVT